MIPGTHHSEKTKQKMREAHLGKWRGKPADPEGAKKRKRLRDAKYQKLYGVHTTVGGKYVYLYGKKRPRPENGRCELCPRNHVRLVYHHWDDKDLKKGAWLCWYCHIFVECFERGLGPKWLELKRRIDMQRR